MIVVLVVVGSLAGCASQPPAAASPGPDCGLHHEPMEQRVAAGCFEGPSPFPNTGLNVRGCQDRARDRVWVCFSCMSAARDWRPEPEPEREGEVVRGNLEAEDEELDRQEENGVLAPEEAQD